MVNAAANESTVAYFVRKFQGYTQQMANDPKTEAQEAIDRIIASQSRKKLD